MTKADEVLSESTRSKKQLGLRASIAELSVVAGAEPPSLPRGLRFELLTLRVVARLGRRSGSRHRSRRRCRVQHHSLRRRRGTARMTPKFNSRYWGGEKERAEGEGAERNGRWCSSPICNHVKTGIDGETGEGILVLE